MQKLGVN